MSLDPLYRSWPYVRRTDIRRGLKVIVQPTAEPIDIDTARAHLRLETTGSPPSNADDDLITGIYLPAAREACEQYLGSSLAPQTIALSLSSFAGWNSGFEWHPCSRDIELPFGPVLGIAAFDYTTGGVSTAFTDYVFDSYSDRVRLAQNVSWPSTDDLPNAVVIQYAAGYSTPGGSPQDYMLPAAIRAAILLTLSQIYDNCTAGSICDITDLPVACKYLLDPYKRRMGFA